MTDTASVFNDVVAQRHSLRAFLPTPVAQDVIDEIFATALGAPSNCNTQPWLVHVVSGAQLAALREALPQRFMAGELSLDFPYDGKYEGVYQERQHASAQALYDALGIAREEKDRRQHAFMRNFTFFDAPHLALLFLPEPFGLREAADLGMFAQTIMLGLTAHGLGSCPQTALSFHADYLREALSIDASNKLVFGISFGHPDPEAAANTCRTDRASLGDVVTFHE